MLDVLHALKEKSWIFTRRTGDGALRFAMLEILRDHAEERLAGKQHDCLFMVVDAHRPAEPQLVLGAGGMECIQPVAWRR